MIRRTDCFRVRHRRRNCYGFDRFGSGLGRAAEPRIQRSPPIICSSPLASLHGCHSNVRGANGADISIGWNWRATMMANSAAILMASRDPRETMDHPPQGAIETLFDLHMPMHVPGACRRRQGEVLRYFESIHNGSHDRA